MSYAVPARPCLLRASCPSPPIRALLDRLSHHHRGMRTGWRCRWGRSWTAQAGPCAATPCQPSGRRRRVRVRRTTTTRRGGPRAWRWALWLPLRRLVHPLLLQQQQQWNRMREASGRTWRTRCRASGCTGTCARATRASCPQVPRAPRRAGPAAARRPRPLGAGHSRLVGAQGGAPRQDRPAPRPRRRRRPQRAGRLAQRASLCASSRERDAECAGKGAIASGGPAVVRLEDQGRVTALRFDRAALASMHCVGQADRKFLIACIGPHLCASVPHSSG
jgi:hypothetical protein